MCNIILFSFYVFFVITLLMCVRLADGFVGCLIFRLSAFDGFCVGIFLSMRLLFATWRFAFWVRCGLPVECCWRLIGYGLVFVGVQRVFCVVCGLSFGVRELFWVFVGFCILRLGFDFMFGFGPVWGW